MIVDIIQYVLLVELPLPAGSYLESGCSIKLTIEVTRMLVTPDEVVRNEMLPQSTKVSQAPVEICTVRVSFTSLYQTECEVTLKIIGSKNDRHNVLGFLDSISAKILLNHRFHLLHFF